jgi:hypothetical protein
MNRLLLAVTILALVASRNSGADPFSEFRIPAHSWSQGSVGLDLNGYWNASDDGFSDTRNDYVQGSFAPRLFLGRDGERLQHSLDLVLQQATTAQQQQTLYRGLGLPEYVSGQSQRETEAWLASGSTRLYPWERPVGISGTVMAQGSYQQGWDRNERSYGWPYVVSNQIEHTNVHSYDYRMNASMSLGVGRVRDATVVQDVHVLERRLRETGAITGPLRPETRRKLAELRYARPAYARAYERPERYYWRDVERVLREDGVLKGDGLDAYDLMRGTEGYQYGITRLSGWFVGPVMGLQHRHTILREEIRQSYSEYSQAGTLLDHREFPESRRITTFLDDVQLGGAIEYHRPFGWHWQFDLASSVTASVRPHTRGMDEATSVAGTWLIADRWLAQVSGSHERSWHTPLDAPDVRSSDSDWDARYGASLGWYVEDHLLLSASVQGDHYAYRTNHVNWRPDQRVFTRQTQFSLGLSYRFLGRMSAPDLLGPLGTR